MPDPHFVPPPIQRRADELSSALGCPAQVTHLHTAGRWRITLTNTRAEVTFAYQLRQRGRINQTSSTLTVDGRPHPLAQGLEHLAAIFADPDQTAQDTPRSGGAPGPMPPSEHDAAPEQVLRLYRRIADKAGPGVTVSVARVDGAWTVGLDTDRIVFRLQMRTYLGRNKPDYTRGPIVLWMDGEDKSEEVDGQLDAALRMMTATFPDAGGAGPRPVGRSGPSPAPNQALATKRNTVIRT